MANEVSLKVCQYQNCKSLKLYDVSGEWSTENDGGFGTPNLPVSDATAATVAFTLSDGTTFSVNAYPTLPNTDNIYLVVTIDEDFYDTLTAQSIPCVLVPNVTSFPDGFTDVVYTVTFNDNSTSTYDATIFFDCNVACCISHLLCKNICDKKAEKKAINANNQLTLLRAAVNCGNDEAAQKKLEKLQKICDGKCGCDDGCGC